MIATVSVKEKTDQGITFNTGYTSESGDGAIADIGVAFLDVTGMTGSYPRPSYLGPHIPGTPTATISFTDGTIGIGHTYAFVAYVLYTINSIPNNIKYSNAATFVAGNAPTLPGGITVITGTHSNLPNQQASTSGSFTGQPSGTITRVGICWRLDTPPTIDDNLVCTGLPKQSWVETIGTPDFPLLSGHTVIYRAFVQIKGVTEPLYGDPVSFDAATSPVSTYTLTTSVSDPTGTTAMVGGVFTNLPTGADIKTGACAVIWAPTDKNAAGPTGGTLRCTPGTTIFQQLLTGLAPNTQYICKATISGFLGSGAIDTTGTTFTTSGGGSSKPSTQMTEPTGTTDTSTMLHGQVLQLGDSTVTAYGVVYGTEVPVTLGNGTAIAGTLPATTSPFDTPVSSLTANTEYRASTYATNSNGTDYSTAYVFTTLSTGANTVPAVTSTGVTNTSSDGATLGGNITSNGNGIVTDYGVCWNTAGSPTIDLPTKMNDTETPTVGSPYVEVLDKDLEPDTTYHYRAYATNSAGTGYGADIIFKTNAVAPDSGTSDEVNKGVAAPTALVTDPVPQSDISIKPLISTESTIFGDINTVIWKDYKVLSQEDKMEAMNEPTDGMAAYIFILDNSRHIVNGTDRFLLQSIMEQKNEKFQVTETFSEDNPAIFFFGKRTTSYSFAGRLLDGESMKKWTSPAGSTPISRAQWKKGFQDYWDNYLRASKLLKMDKGPGLAMLMVDNEVYQGYPVFLGSNKTSSDTYTAGFSMTWIVTSHTHLLDTGALADFMNFGDSKTLQKALQDYSQLQTELNIHQTLSKVIHNALDAEAAHTGKTTIEYNAGKFLATSTTSTQFKDFLSPSVMNYIGNMSSSTPDGPAIAAPAGSSSTTEEIRTNEDATVEVTYWMSPLAVNTLKNKYNDKLYKVTAVPWLVACGDSTPLSSSGDTSPESMNLQLFDQRVADVQAYIAAWVANQKRILGQNNTKGDYVPAPPPTTDASPTGRMGAINTNDILAAKGLIPLQGMSSLQINPGSFFNPPPGP